ncbi:MFS transporter [Cellvibrio sp. UBA7661]|uniref:MFS transporter n=1 Tax=Cellvibrio sp. UBA7661 TaxID=1946311 RepID=UPI002F34F706
MSQMESIPVQPSTQPLTPVEFDPTKTVLPVIGAVSFVHLLNDLIQAILPSIYPLLKSDYALSFTQIGMITLAFQMTASLLQPGIGLYTDKHPKPYLLPTGMLFTLCGLVMLALASNFTWLLIASAMIGLGSSTFHPEASRVARMASGGRFGFAQSFFQVGGNAGSAFGPLLAAAIILPQGQGAIGWFTLFAILGFTVLFNVSRWTIRSRASLKSTKKNPHFAHLSRAQIAGALTVLAILVFSKYIYMAAFTNYYTFYMMEKFSTSVANAQLLLFLFLAAVAVGTFAGGPIGDKVGRKAVIWISILGAAPFTLLFPYCNLFWTAVLSVVIGLVLSSAFSAIVVLAQELVPTKIGMISGVFFGLMFGISGIAAAGLGAIADATSIEYMFDLCAYLPLIGIVTVLLPAMKRD